ncbi:hypothetical protein [Sporisorium scitamineum]|uniref:Uncharacterized protein n=1 Tax=Sporisorium scitamineum TaxID=49012 RepID=A0A0F7SBX5_9BASI|nr:hypothetical protein [Sporisorium scitamineum]
MSFVQSQSQTMSNNGSEGQKWASKRAILDVEFKTSGSSRVAQVENWLQVSGT